MNYILNHAVGILTFFAILYLVSEVRNFRIRLEKRDLDASLKAQAIAQEALKVKGEL